MERVLVEGLWLKEHLQDVTLVDVRPMEEYIKGHIPGAIHFDIWDYHWFDTTPDGMRTFNAKMAKGLAEVGLDPLRTTVVYEDYSGMLAARMAWVLRYFNFKEAVLLDGGLREWLRCGNELETIPSSRPPAEGVNYHVRPDILATVDGVHANCSSQGAHVVDCRSEDEYTGKHVRADRGGHIPGALNIEWKKNLTSDGYFLPPSELQALFAPNGWSPDTEIIVYCHGGYRSAHTFFALWIASYGRVRNYIGSWGEWGNRSDLPLEA